MKDPKAYLVILSTNTQPSTVPKNVPHGGKSVYFLKPCLIWRGATDNTGYGVMRVEKGFMGAKAGIVRVHRLAKFLQKPYPVKCQVDHLCRNRLCCEPTHLEVIGPKTHGKLSKQDQEEL